MGTLNVEEPNDNIVGGLQCLNSVLLATKFRLRRVKKKGKKRAKNEKLRFAKKTFLVLRVYELGISSGDQYGSKKSCGEGVLAKKNFRLFVTI